MTLAARLVLLVAVLIVAVLSASHSASACDFCLPPTGGFAKSVREADAVAVATVVGRQVVAGEAGAKTVTTFQLGEALRGSVPEVGSRLRSRVAWPGTAEDRRVLLLLDCSDASNRSDARVAVRDALPDPDGRLARYFAAAFGGAERSPAERAAFYARWLQSSHDTIAEDAYQQFASVPLSALREPAVRAALSADKLREWLASNDVPAGRKGLYGLLLGLVGEPTADAERLRARLAESQSPAEAGGLLAGLGLLAGQPTELLAATVGDRRAKRHLRQGALAAARFFAQQGSAAERDAAALRTVLSAGLSDPEILPAVVAEMARFRAAWMEDALREVWTDPHRRTEEVRSSILQYVRGLPEPQRTGFYTWLDQHP